MKLIRKIEDKTGKGIKELYHEFMDLPRGVRTAIDIGVILILLLTLVLLSPSLKYSLMNGFGAAEVYIKVVDSQTRLPLIDAAVTIDQETLATDKQGMVHVSGVQYGNQKVRIEKTGFETGSYEYVLKDEINGFEAAMTSNGKRVIVEAKQYLSAEPVKSFAVSSTDGSNLTAVGVDGVALFFFQKDTTLEIGAEIKADYFVTQKATLNSRQQNIKNSLTLVPYGEHFFLASRGGATTIYKSLMDGSEQERFIEPTGFEDGSSKLYLSPNGEFAVYESSRRPESGRRQMHSVNLRTKEVKEFDSGVPAWKVLDVNNDRVVYIADAGDPSNNKNQTLKTYSFKAGEIKELIKSPAMSFVAAANGKIVFAELIERGSYPGGYLLRQLMAVNENDGKFKKLSQNATITDVRVVTPTKIQYTQINPSNGAEVRFVYDTVSEETLQASVDRTAKRITPSPFEQDYFAWTIGSTTLEFGSRDVEVKKAYKYNAPDLIPKRWISQDYLILHSFDNNVSSSGLLVRTDNGKSAPLP